MFNKSVRFIKLLLLITCLFGIFLALMWFLGDSSDLSSAKNKDEGKVQIPFSNGEIYKESCSTLYSLLEDAGFMNISVAPREIENNLKDYRISKILVDGKESFKEGDYFHPGVTVEITCTKID